MEWGWERAIQGYKKDIAQLEAKVERLEAEREDASALGDDRICRLEKERDKLHEALKEITMHTNPQIMLRIAGEALKGDKL